MTPDSIQMVDILPLPESSTSEPLWSWALAAILLAVIVYRQWRRQQTPRRRIARDLQNGAMEPRTAAHELARLLPEPNPDLDRLRFQREGPDKAELMRYLSGD